MAPYIDDAPSSIPEDIAEVLSSDDRFREHAEVRYRRKAEAAVDLGYVVRRNVLIRLPP